VSDKQIDVAIAVEVGGDDLRYPAHLDLRKALGADRLQGSRQRIAIELAVAAPTTGECQIEIPFDVEVEDRTAGGAGRCQTEPLSGLFERSFSGPPPDLQPFGTVTDEIEPAVVVEIGHHEMLDTRRGQASFGLSSLARQPGLQSGRALVHDPGEVALLIAIEVGNRHRVSRTRFGGESLTAKPDLCRAAERGRGGLISKELQRHALDPHGELA
jgi:hypothetical protein